MLGLGVFANYTKSGFLISIAKDSDTKLIRKLKSLDAAIERKFIRKATRSGAAIVAKATKDKAPKLSGRLRKQIRVRAMKRKKGRIGYSVVISARASDADAFYGAFVELGANGKEGLGFVRKSYEETEDLVDGHIRTELWRQIEAFAKSGAK